MFLNYLALGLLVMAVTLVFYGFIYIHDIPYNLAKKHNHPQAEAIHVACWLSLFTLHAIWPIVFIWAIIKPKPMQVMISDRGGPDNQELDLKLEQINARLRDLEQAARLDKARERELTHG
jgi:hypothetical protein